MSFWVSELMACVHTYKVCLHLCCTSYILAPCWLDIQKYYVCASLSHLSFLMWLAFAFFCLSLLHSHGGVLARGGLHGVSHLDISLISILFSIYRYTCIFSWSFSLSLHLAISHSCCWILFCVSFQNRFASLSLSLVRLFVSLLFSFFPFWMFMHTCTCTGSILFFCLRHPSFFLCLCSSFLVSLISYIL